MEQRLKPQEKGDERRDGGRFVRNLEGMEKQQWKNVPWTERGLPLGGPRKICF